MPAKLESKWDGPFKILKVCRNGTVVIQRSGYSQVVSIRRIRPFRMGANDVSLTGVNPDRADRVQ